nr:nicotinate-nucleotide adenylyltransferase [uncultured Mogibacterium sp.]
MYNHVRLLHADTINIYENGNYMDKIAIFGGTFDPIHLAHTKLAETALEELGLDKVVFMPNAVSPFKLDSKILPAEHRCKMIEIAIQNNKRLEMTTYEIDKQGVSYTYDTLQNLSVMYDSCLYFILGYDSVVAIDTWYKGADILKTFPLITAVRPGTDIALGERKIAEFKKVYDAEIHLLHMPPFDCSSSQIRDLCRTGQPINGLVNKLVEEYIINNGLYKD